MEVSRSYAGYIAILRRDMQEFGMDFKTLHTVYYIYALVLHTAAPLDVALLVETGQELHDGGDLLAVAGSADEGFHHPGVLGQTIEGGLYLLNLRLERSFLEHTQIAVEGVVGHMDETVLLPNLVENAVGRGENRFHHMPPLRILQLVVAATWERHQVLMVLIAAAGERRIEFVEVEALLDFLQNILWHLLVVEHSDSIATLAAVDALADALKGAVVLVVVDFHLGILRELERVGGIGRRLHAEEDDGQTVADDIVEIHYILEAVARRNLHPAAHLAVRNFHYGQTGLMLADGILVGIGKGFALHDEVDAVVL